MLTKALFGTISAGGILLSIWEEIRKGDLVLLRGEPGEIEFVADRASDPEDWYVTEYGGGVMMLEPKVFGRLFVSDTQNYEDLELVTRG